MLTKICTVCKIEKPIGAFSKRSDCPSGRRASCRECRLKQRHRWIAKGGRKNVAKISEKYRDTKAYRENYLKRTYGITTEDWGRLFKRQ